MVEATLKAFGFDIGYRIAHHADITSPPPVEVYEYTDGPVWDRDGVQIRVAPTYHRPVAPTIGFRVEYGGASVVLAGDTVPCESLDALAPGAGALVHTVIRKDIDRRDAACSASGTSRLPLLRRAGGGHRDTGRGGHSHPDALRAALSCPARRTSGARWRRRRSTARSSWVTICTASRFTPASAPSPRGHDRRMTILAPRRPQS